MVDVIKINQGDVGQEKEGEVVRRLRVNGGFLGNTLGSTSDQIYTLEPAL